MADLDAAKTNLNKGNKIALRILLNAELTIASFTTNTNVYSFVWK